MKNKGKVLALTLSAAALVAASVFGTMAYLTDNEAVTNTFTVGRVGLDLDEADVNLDGTYVQDVNRRDKENKYHLLPGHEYIKDPIVHIDEDSEDCWVFVKIENGIKDIEENDEDYVSVEKQVLGNGWQQLKDDENASVANVYYKKWTKPTNAPTESRDAYDLPVFAKFAIDGDNVVNVPEEETAPNGKFDLDEYADKSIVVTAYAVQLDGFEDKPYSAWDAADFE